MRQRLFLALRQINPNLKFSRLFKQGKGKVRCNVCEKSFSHFLRERHRENARCPGCGSLESTRVLWFYLSGEVLGKKNKNRFLYFSPEPSLFKKLINRDIELIEKPMGYFDVMNNTESKLQGSRYDVILFPQVLQFVKEEHVVFTELKRLLRPGGFVVLMTLVNWEMDRTYEKPVTDEDRDRLKRFYEPGLQRVYGADVEKRLIKAGFHVETVDYADQLGSAAREYYRLGDGNREMIFKCKK
jgi:SAM-dependent methyltransferase